MVILIGLTGGIACGKSTVSSALHSQHGMRIIDADLVVRDLQKPGATCTKRIARRWPECVSPSGELDRAALGRIVFADPKARRELAAIMNGPIFRALLKSILASWWDDIRDRGSAHVSGPRVVILDAPTLLETGFFTHLTSGVVVVAADEEVQVQRIVSRNGFTEGEARQRIAAQMPLSEKRRRADYVIENSSSRLVDLEQPIAECVEWMKGRSSTRITTIVALTSAVGMMTLGTAVCVALRIARWIVVV